MDGGQNYQEIMPGLSLDDETKLDLSDHFSPGPVDDNTSSPKGGGGLFPKSSIKKPIRRRSRACKKTPATLLTADANNFRALVQQFTGCHTAPPAFGTYKGPINLNFEQANYYCEKQRQVDWNMDDESDQCLFSFGRNNAAAAAAATVDTTGDGELFVSRANDNSRADALTLDHFEIDPVRSDDLWG